MATKSPLTITVDLKRIGKRLKEARLQLRYSSRELSKACGVSAAHILRIENGRELTLTKLAKVAAALGFPPALLLDNSLQIEVGFRAVEHQAELLADPELLSAVDAAPKDAFARTLLSIYDLTDLLTVAACQLLLSANPIAALEAMAIPLPTARMGLTEFVRAYGLHTDTTERAAVFKAIREHPFAKLKALGLLSAEIIQEHLSREA